VVHDADRAQNGMTTEISDRRLIVIDDHPVVQVGLRVLLAREPWVSRCLAAASSTEAIALTRRYEPHVALVDLLMGAESGVELCRLLKRERPSLAVLFMSGTGRIAAPVARAAGAVGFIAKDAPPAALVATVYRAAIGRNCFATGMPQPPTKLTRRELDVLREIARGASNPETARALQLSPHTVKQYSSSLYRKLGARNRTDAVRSAQQLGLIL